MSCSCLHQTIVGSALYVCCIWIVFSGHLAAANQIQATSYPIATTVVIGQYVRFNCTVLEPPGSSEILQWYIEWDEDTETIRLLSATDPGDINAVDRPEFKGRGSYKTQYSMSPAEAGFKTHRSVMEISSSTLKDNGYFGCVHQKPGEVHRTLFQQKARLTIVPQPAVNPECNLNKHQKVFVLTCVSLQGDPHAHLTWYEGSQIKSLAIQTFNSIEVIGESDIIDRTFVCYARQGDTEVGTCSVTLTGPTGSMKPPTTEAGSTMLMTTPGAVGDETVTNKSANTTAIVGGVLGTVILVLLLLLLLLWFTKLREKSDEAPAAPRKSKPRTNTSNFNDDPLEPNLGSANQNGEGHAYMHLQPHTMQPTAPSQIYESSIATESVSANQTDQDPYYTQPIQVSSNQTEEDPYYNTQSIP